MLAEILNGSAFFLAEANIIYPDGTEVPVDLGDLGAQVETVSSWPQPLVLGLCALLGLICIGLVVIILLQKKRASGIGAAIAGSGETYWSKNKGKSAEGSLEKYTKWGGFAFLAVALLINMFM